MPKLLSAKKSNPKKPAAKTAARRSAVVYQVVRGSAKNPHPMALHSTEAAARKTVAWLKSHFPGHKIRVHKVRKETAR